MSAGAGAVFLILNDDGDIKAGFVFGLQLVHDVLDRLDQLDVAPFLAGDGTAVVVAGHIPVLGAEIVAELVAAENVAVAGENFIADIAQRFAGVGPQFSGGQRAGAAVGNDVLRGVDVVGLGRYFILVAQLLQTLLFGFDGVVLAFAVALEIAVVVLVAISVFSNKR